MSWWGNILKGAGVGAGVGSLFPGFGTLIGAGVGGLGGLLFGSDGKPVQPPDINAPMYNLGKYPGNWVQQGRNAIQQQSQQTIENMLRQIDQSASQRGLLNTSFGMEKGREAADIVAQQSSGALANLLGQAAQMQQTGQIAGMGMYNQDYMNWITQMNAAQDSWINDIMGMFSDYASINALKKKT